MGREGGLIKNYVFGYARVSTEQQNLDRQLDALRKYGCDMIYNEKLTGTKRDRPELAKMLDRMTEGDTVVDRISVQAGLQYQGLDRADRAIPVQGRSSGQFEGIR